MNCDVAHDAVNLLQQLVHAALAACNWGRHAHDSLMAVVAARYYMSDMKPPICFSSLSTLPSLPAIGNTTARQLEHDRKTKVVRGCE
jgi:hypothetical protein